MRSALVYLANNKVQNRFQLCSLTSTSARRMARSSVGMHVTINEALEAISGHSAPVAAESVQADELKAPDNGAAFITDAAV